MFYSSGTFILQKNKWAGYVLSGNFLTSPKHFLQDLGSQVGMVNTVVLSLAYINFQDCTCSQEPSPSTKLCMLEVGPLLQGLWALNPGLDLSFEEDPQSRHRLAPFVGADSLTMTYILRSLLKGSLGAKKYSHLLRAVGLRRDGSGGILFWDSLDRWYDPNKDYCCSLRQPFAVADNGGQFELLSIPKLKLFDLPDLVLERIFDIVLPTCDIRVVDVDNDTSLHDGLIDMN